MNDEKDHMDSPNLLHMGLSKQTLATLGITLGKKHTIKNMTINITPVVQFHEIFVIQLKIKNNKLLYYC